MTRDDRRALCGTRVTLDGHAAVIGGAALPYALITRLDGRGGSVEYAWPTVARVVAAGGRFRS